MPETDYLAQIASRRSALRAWCDTALARAKPFIFEIGSGHGHFLTAFAQAHPLLLCVGIDQMLERVVRAERKRERARLPNLHFVRAAAEDFLPALPDSARFAAVYILFPDPWPKRRHQKHRLLQAPFLQILARHAQPEARLYFRTDHRDYFTEARTLIGNAAEWEIVDEPWPFERPTVFQVRQSEFFSLVAARRG